MPVSPVVALTEHDQPRRYDNRKYVLISPCRDEAEYMRQTFDSVINSVHPTG